MDARQEEEGWRGEAGSGLPAEIIGEIIGWLTEIRSVAQCMAVCRAWHDLVRSQGRLWESLAGSRRLGIDPGFVPDHCDDWFQWIRARVKCTALFSLILQGKTEKYYRLACLTLYWFT
jgi:hypothetical protein